MIKTEIKKVWKNVNGTKFVTIPLDSEIKEGDYVKITKIEE